MRFSERKLTFVSFSEYIGLGCGTLVYCLRSSPDRRHDGVIRRKTGRNTGRKHVLASD
jgi:hypothetical protein